jgi:uncharacterized membrane protein YeaQ/YmgE (transglycosylase-associated protein family)
MGGLGGILILSLLGASISGVVIATIAKMIIPGKERISGIELFLIGTGAAWLGGFIAGLFGWGDGRGIHFGVLAIQVAIAAIAIILWTNFRNRQMKKMLVPDMPQGPDAPGVPGVPGTGNKDRKDDKGGPGIPGVPGI